MRKEYASVAINKLHNQYKYLTHKGFIESNRESLRAAQWVISCSRNVNSAIGDRAQEAWDKYKLDGFENKKAFDNFMECVYKLEADLDISFRSGWTTDNNNESYVNDDILQGFQSKTGHFNYQRLITLIEELNFNYSNKKVYSSCMVLRAILDHIPPLLGKDDFDDVVNHYNWGSEKSSRRKAIKELLIFRNIPDDVLHGRISSKSDVIDMSYLPNKFSINILLKECLESVFTPTAQYGLVKQKKVKNDDTKTDIRIGFEESKISWANYAVSRWVWSSFKMVLSINNFRNKLPEYIRAYLLAKSTDGRWEARNFVFLNREDEKKSRANEDFRIEPGYKEKVSLFVSSYNVGTIGSMPDIDRDTLKLIIETESGNTFTLPIKAGWISKG
jgi:hypothetical protein